MDTIETQGTAVEDLCPSLFLVLGIPMITDRILFYLSISDVLNCSLVSELWRKISRTYLRHRKRLEITFVISSSCQLSKLDNMLMNSTASNLPFAGSKVSACMPFSHGKPYYRNNLLVGARDPDVLCYQRQHNDVVTMYSNVFRKLPMKNLRIDFSRDLSIKDCACENVLKKLLIMRARDTTEYLEIVNWPPEIQSLWKYLNVLQIAEDTTTLHQHNLFRVLRTCNLRNLRDLPYEYLLCEVITFSPMLENIYGPVSDLVFPLSDDATNHYGLRLPCPKLPTIIRDVVATSRNAITLLLHVKPSLELLGFDPRILSPNERETEIQVISNMKKSLATIIENCSSSLTTLVCNDLTYLLPRAINIPLINCTVLKLLISPPYRDFEDDLLILRAINFPAHLPNLRNLDLLFKSEMVLFGEQIFTKNKIEDRSSLYRCATFTCFSVHTLLLAYYEEDFDDEIPCWPWVADVFPNVKSLHLDNGYRQSPEIAVNVGLPWSENLEFVTCFFFENSDKWCWIILTELLENLCDISIQELLTVNCINFNEWSYAPTRHVLFQHGSENLFFC